MFKFYDCISKIYSTYILSSTIKGKINYNVDNFLLVAFGIRR